MDIAYPYNESLPKGAAHDVYVFRNCASLSHAGLQVALCCGWGSQPDARLYTHYDVEPSKNLHIRRLPILRHMGPFSCNALFFWQAQRDIVRLKPNWVITSVFKQAEYHVRRKVAGIRYAYEVHQLGWYPSCDTPERRRTAARERAILEQMDLITVTTEALQRILQATPYELKVPIRVVPLAVERAPLPAPPASPLTVMYVGQLYASQGVDLLLQAAALVSPELQVEIVGGKEAEIGALRQLSQRLGIANRVHFHGFVPPSQLAHHVQRAHAFVAPFRAEERMPYVAHTKLYEYAAWGRPVIAPDLEVVKEHLANGDCHLFEPGDVHSLASCLQRISGRISRPRTPFSWTQRAVYLKELLEVFTLS